MALTLMIIASFIGPSSVHASEQVGKVLGVHILHPYELADAEELLRPTTESENNPVFVTIPVTLNDLQNKDEWQSFFNTAKEKNITPIVRLTTRFENGAWQVPSRRDITLLFGFLNRLEWPSKQKYIIVFNEVNHAKEWGGTIDPSGYADILLFTANWAHAENRNYVVLPAAMDLAAPNGRETMEAFTYLEAMVAAQPEALHKIDIWNSHSYPNPGFSAAPDRTAKNSLRGYTHELAFVREKTGRDLKVMITETGWVKGRFSTKQLENYYTYALKNVWSDPRILAVTPFVLRGDPGPFSDFAFLDRNSNPTAHYIALQNAIKQVQPGSPRSSAGE